MTAVQPSANTARSVVYDGRVWSVSEHPVPYSRNRRSLVFSSDGVARRVQHYPANWLELSEEALAAICAHA